MLEERRYSFRVNSASCVLDVYDQYTAYVKDVYAENRRVGDGTALMECICEFADAHHLLLYLIVRAFGDPHRSRPNDELFEWYYRFGFVRDTSISSRPVRMLRKPSQEIHTP